MLEQGPLPELPVRAPYRPLPGAQQFATTVCGEAGRGGAGFSSTLDMSIPIILTTRKLTHSLSHSPLPAFLPAGPPVSHDLSVCGSLASLRLAGDLSVWMECWNRGLSNNSLSELSPDLFQGLGSLTDLYVARQGGSQSILLGVRLSRPNFWTGPCKTTRCGVLCQAFANLPAMKMCNVLMSVSNAATVSHA